MQQVRSSCVPAVRAMLLALIITLAAALVAKPQLAQAEVSGQLEAWGNVSFGSNPGELFNPSSFGVDPVDGSVYILSSNLEGSESRVDKFSASGTLEGSASIPRPPGAEGLPNGLVGIAVNHVLERFYLVEDDFGADTTTSLELPDLATNVLAFST